MRAMFVESSAERENHRGWMPSFRRTSHALCITVSGGAATRMTVALLEGPRFMPWLPDPEAQAASAAPTSPVASHVVLREENM